MPKNGRTRAWVLVKVKSSEQMPISKIAKEIYKRGVIDSRSGVIRVDIVTGPFDLVVPVEAETKADLLDVVENKILGTKGVESTLTLVTIQHSEDNPPHGGRRFEEVASNPNYQIRDDNVWG